jgi:hypothetical protein
MTLLMMGSPDQRAQICAHITIAIILGTYTIITTIMCIISINMALPVSQLLIRSLHACETCPGAHRKDQRELLTNCSRVIRNTIRSPCEHN